MDFPPDWDLLALVRSCSSTTAAATSTSSPPLVVPQQEELCFSPTPSTSSSSSVLFGFLNGGQQDFCNNYNMNGSNSFQSLSSSSLTSPVSTSSSSIVTAGRPFTVGQLYPDMRRGVRPSQVIFEGSSPSVTASTTTGATSQSQRAKKRKNLMKKVCHIPAEGLSSDMWAWRKYGQKPIKGSPYPRGYYRCSSSKGCLARKQVERNRTDPKMLIVTYTSEHNHPIPAHRNTLAGSTRQKTITSTCTPPEQSTASPSTLTEKSESKTDVTKDLEDNDIEGFSDLMFNDDFFVGFEKIDGGGSDDSDYFSEQFSPAAEVPWLANGSTATGEV